MRKLTSSELNRLNVEEYKKAEKTPIIIVLDNVRSMNNIGSIFRTADSFRIQAIYLCGITASPPHKDIHKTALGATESVNWKYFESTAEAITLLKENNYNICAIEQADESVMLNEFLYNETKKIALVFGNEINGINKEIINKTDVCIEIPQFGTKHSFNIAVTVGIVVWHFYFLSQKFISISHK